ncbi:MAG: glycosyltransferase family 39 protein, partial [Candidatus Roizmanbacteria bacterium]|nr:glycosyltransferase family 39 protein [Candidatus Roizmanbacteria bacterium]
MNIYSLFIFAFLIRLINLNQSLWLDEAIVAKVVRAVSVLKIPFQFSIHDFHPPLYYMFMSAWSTFFGSSEIALRFPSIIFSLIAGFYMYKIGSFLKDKKTAQWATAFFLFNPLIIYYSQEARMYMMATAFLTGALFHFIQIIQVQNPHKKHIFFFNIFSALALFTFYGSAFFIFGMLIVIFFLFPKKRAFILQMNIGFVLS